MMNNNILNIITWTTIYDKHPNFFDSFLPNKSKSANKAIWQAYLYKFIKEGFTNSEIIEKIMSKNPNLLFEEEKKNMRNAFDILHNEYAEFYNNNKYNFLISTDEKYPDDFNRIFDGILDKINYSGTVPQFVPNIFIYQGDLNLISSEEKKLAVIGTRECEIFSNTQVEISRIHRRYPNAICVTGLASGVDSMGVNEFEKSICFIGEDLSGFLKKKQKDKERLSAKIKVQNNGLIISHKLPHEVMSSFDFKNALLERNLFVILLSNSIHPIEFGIKSGTINAIHHAIKNKKPIFTPRKLVSDNVMTKYKNDISFY